MDVENHSVGLDTGSECPPGLKSKPENSSAIERWGLMLVEATV